MNPASYSEGQRFKSRPGICYGEKVLFPPRCFQKISSTWIYSKISSFLSRFANGSRVPLLFLFLGRQPSRYLPVTVLLHV